MIEALHKEARAAAKDFTKSNEIHLNHKRQYHFKAIKDDNNVGDVAVREGDSYLDALKQVQREYPPLKFQLTNCYCLDCQQWL